MSHSINRLFVTNLVIVFIFLALSNLTLYQDIFLICFVEALIICNLLFVGRIKIGYSFLFLSGFSYYMIAFPFLYSLGLANIEVFNHDLFVYGSLVSLLSLTFFVLGYFISNTIPRKEEKKYLIQINKNEDKHLLFLSSVIVSILVLSLIGLTYIHIPSVLFSLFLVIYVLRDKGDFSRKSFFILV